MASAASKPGRPLLVIAHPGHELRLYGWLRKADPAIVILTDGSGSTGISRIDLSRKLVAATGGEIVIAGKFAEPELYALIMSGDTAPLIRFSRELADLLTEANIGQIVCDAVEGYHPAHDLCLPLTRAALRLCAAGSQRSHCEYRVIGDPRPEQDHNPDLLLQLDEAALREKIERSYEYAALSGTVLTEEVQYMFATFGEASFGFEAFRPAGTETPQLRDGLRYYERRGEQQVSSGRYRQVLRYAEHIAPIEAALSECAN